MAVMNVYDNGLNVQYVPDFIEKECADNYLLQLKTLPFYTPTFKIRGKSVKPKRQVLGYGDEGVTYDFSGTSIPAEPWTPLMTELRNQVEKFAGCAFNFVLLNLYPDGSSYISQHKDDERGLDQSFPIVVLSFGAERTIEFKKPHTPSTSLKLSHGSLYSMMKPTNKLFTHGIAPEPHVKDIRISLTFRHLIPDPVYPLLKKPKLEISENLFLNATTNAPKFCFGDIPSTGDDSTKQDVTSKPTLSCLDNSTSDGVSSNAVTTSVQSPDPVSDPLHTDFEQSDWLEKHYQNINENPILMEWSLNWNTFVQIVMDYNFNLRLHIRIFKESKTGELLPTKRGIVMTLATYANFEGKIHNFNFKSVNDSFISNNQLLVLCIDKEICLMQQIFPLNTEGFYLKPSVLKLFDDQVYSLKNLTSEITETLIKIIFTVQLPKLILNQSPVCMRHFSLNSAKQNFIKCICSEIISCIYELTQCEACLYMPADQNLHDCLKPLSDQFISNRQAVLLNLDLFNIIGKLRNECTCFYNQSFFNEIYMQSLDGIIVNELSKHTIL